MKVSLGVLSGNGGSGGHAAADGSARVDAGNTKVRSFFLSLLPAHDCCTVIAAMSIESLASILSMHAEKLGRKAELRAETNGDDGRSFAFFHFFSILRYSIS